MSRSSRRLAGILLIIFPTVIYGGVTLLEFIMSGEPGYLDNPVRQDLWRAGHAHAGVWLILSLVLLRFVDEANLSPPFREAARHAAPIAAILGPAGFFLSILEPGQRQPNELIYLTYAGGAVLAVGLFVLGIGLLRKPAETRPVD